MPKVGKASAALRAHIKRIFESDPEISATECAKRLKEGGEALGMTTLRGKASKVLKTLRAGTFEPIKIEEEQTGDLHDAGAPTGDRFDYGHDGYVFTLRGEDEFQPAARGGCRPMLALLQPGRQAHGARHVPRTLRAPPHHAH